MESILAKRMENLETETSFDVLAKAKTLEKQGEEIIHMEIGEPDFDTPQNIKDAAVKALKAGYTHYVPAAGIAELRKAIAEEVSRTRKIPVDVDEVVVTPGAKPIIFFTMLACVEEGEEVMYPNPGFPVYESMAKFVGAKPVPIPLKEENEFRIDPEDVRRKINKKTRLIILNSPENPTGGVLTRDDLEVFAEEISDRDDVLVLSDEIYSRIIYEGEPDSISTFPEMKEKTIIVDGFSKTFAMTGWRLGYGVMNKELAGKITQLMINSNSCTSAFTQWAGVEALKGPQEEPKRNVDEFRRRREVIVSGLNNIRGITCKKPHGAFYVFPNISGTGLNCRDLQDRLLNEAGVATLAGTSFGRYGDEHLRLSFANSINNIKKALTKIETFVSKLED